MKALFLLTVSILSGSAWAAEYPRADLNGYTSQHDEPLILSTDSCVDGRTCWTLPAACTTAFDMQDSATDTRDEIHALLATASPGNRVFCFDNGDDWTGLGDTLIVPSDADCTAEHPCWLINAWNVASQSLALPWQQPAENHVTFDDEWDIEGPNWIVAFLRWDGDGARTQPVVDISANNVLMHGNELTNFASDAGVISLVDINSGTDEALIQCNFIHDWVPAYGREVKGIRLHASKNGTEDNVVVNNEIRNVTHGVSVNDNTVVGDGDHVAGLVVENNDVYTTRDYYTDCHGTYDVNGPCAMIRGGGISFKSGALASNIIRIIHNRRWGSRTTDRSNPGGCCTSGSRGGLFGGSNTHDGDPDSFKYALFLNNIGEDAQTGYNNARNGPFGISFIGNLLYNVQIHSSQVSYGLELEQTDGSEFYLNSIIFAGGTKAVDMNGTASTNNDLLCNVFIDGVASGTVGPGAGSEDGFNVFYATPQWSGDNTNDVTDGESSTGWVASRDYGTGDVVFPTVSPGEQDFDPLVHGFIMVATSDAGASGEVEPVWTGVGLGNYVVDGGVTWRVVRAPYTYWRRLLSAPEQSTIPYAKPLADPDLPEWGHCAGSGIGDRPSIGIDDSAPSWSN